MKIANKKFAYIKKYLSGEFYKIVAKFVCHFHFEVHHISKTKYHLINVQYVKRQDVFR